MNFMGFLLADDLRMNSGVGTMSREFVLGTLKHYDWVQIGGAIKHPDEGKVINMDESVAKESGVEDAKLTIYPVSGYGNPDLIRTIIDKHQIDGILHYTDPRFWGWLYQMEHEVRQNIPLMFLVIKHPLSPRSVTKPRELDTTTTTDHVSTPANRPFGAAATARNPPPTASPTT